MKLRALLIAAALLVVFAPPAGAQRGVTVQLDGLQDGASVSGTLPLSVHASATSGIRRLTLTVDGEVVIDQSPNGIKQNVDASFDWDTTRYVGSSGLARNREYSVQVRAVSHSGGEDQLSALAIVNNQPAVPSGLSTSVAGRDVTIAWDANPEPDITGYRVERYFGSDYVEAATVTETIFTEAPGSGRFSYRVVAIRHSDASPEGIESVPTEQLTMTVSAPAPGSGAGGGGTGKSGGSSKRGGSYSTNGSVGATGLPGGAALPGSRGLGGIPELPAPEWGSFKKRLPYKLPKGGVPLRASAVSRSGGPLRIIPPDGLRWVALGLLFLCIAGFARLMAIRITPPSEPAKIEA
ncbi:MAG TPA: hypothetical protein VE174_13695 [Actinomycetota bacterium]|nr:hypothetical protein [Actinomycetota bacterium]